MPGPTSKLFDRIPSGLFGPLGDHRHAELYWSVIAAFYQYEFEHEPFVVVRPLALEIAERALRESSHWTERRAELESLAVEEDATEPACTSADEASLARALARRLVTRLEKSGWVHFQYRSGTGEVMSFHPYAARVAETLMRVVRDEQPGFEGLIHAVASLLEVRAFAQRPGVSLLEAKRLTQTLARELKILERNIHLFTQRILDEAVTASRVLEEGLDRYEHAVMTNYHRLKTVDNVYRQRSAILERLATIERDDASLDRAAEWYAEQNGTDRRHGRALANGDIDNIRAHFDAIPGLVGEIDARNARFSHATLRRLMYLLRQDRRTEGQLQFLVDALARHDVPELDFDVFKCELLFGELIYKPPQQRARTQPQALRRRNRENDENLRREVSAKLDRRFTRKRVEAFVADYLAGRTSASLDDVPVDNDEDYVRLLYLAAYGLSGSNFVLELGQERVRKTVYEHPTGRLLRRTPKRRAT